MATRQYVGARYVPKFYEYNNGVWEENTEYEALTIVQYHNNSYTSKKPVPANIGNPQSNTEYWVCTGNYNAQVEHYREEVEEYKEDVLEYQNSVEQYHDEYTSNNADIYSRITAQNRKYIFIGSSYNTATHSGGWGSKVIEKLGLTLGTNCWNSGDSGASFGNGRFLTQLQTIANTLTAEEKNSITDIVVVGDCNDWNVNDGTIGTGVADMESYVFANFPNTRYWILLGEWSYENDSIRAGILNAHNIVTQVNTKGKVVPCFYNFVNPIFLEDDMVHPTEAGQYLLAFNVINITNGGTYYFKYYTDLYTQIRDAGMGRTVNILGEITPSGVHIKTEGQGWRFDNQPTALVANTWTGIARCNVDEQNYLFERKAVFDAPTLIAKQDGTYENVLVKYKVEKETPRSWLLSIFPVTIADKESDYPISNITGIYPFIDTTLPIWAN